MKKKLMSMLLAAIMVLSTVAGCGQKEEAEAPATETAEGEAEEVTDEVPQEITKVKWIARCDAQEDDEQVIAEMNKILGPKYGLELELVPISSGEYNDRMNLMITSGEEYDICYTASFTNVFLDNVAREAFLPLDDLLAGEAGELLTSVMPEGHTAVTTVDGTVYAIPNYQLMYTQYGVYVQKDLADEFGLDTASVKNISDLEPFMDWVLENKEDIWPLCETNVADTEITAYDMFGAGVLSVEIGDESYEIQKTNEVEQNIARWKRANEYFKKGYIRSDAATVTDNTADKAANRYAMIVGISKPGGEAEYASMYGEEYIQIPLSESYMVYEAGATTMLAININSENPEAAMKMIGVMWSDPEIYNMLLYGIEGEHYNKVGENRVEQIADSGYNRAGQAWQFGNQFNAWLLPAQADDVWEVTESMNQSAKKSLLTGFVADLAPVEAEIAQINSVKVEYGNGFLYTDNFDQWLNDYNAKLETAGIETVKAEMESQITAWREANGK